VGGFIKVKYLSSSRCPFESITSPAIFSRVLSDRVDRRVALADQENVLHQYFMCATRHGSGFGAAPDDKNEKLCNAAHFLDYSIARR
jgi:hypothetical protein